MDKSSYYSSPDKIKVSAPSQGIEQSCICVVGVSLLPLSKKCLKGYAEVVIWRRSGNTMIYNTLHNTKDCATRTPLNPGLNSGAPEGSAISDGRRITVNRDEHYTIDDFRWGEYKDWSINPWNMIFTEASDVNIMFHGLINPCINRNWKSLTVLLYDIKSNLN